MCMDICFLLYKNLSEFGLFYLFAAVIISLLVSSTSMLTQIFVYILWEEYKV
jgi:hypothetical protein